MLFCCQPIPPCRAYICGDSSQLNTAANDTYQNNACQELAEFEKVASISFILACDVDRMRQVVAQQPENTKLCIHKQLHPQMYMQF